MQESAPVRLVGVSKHYGAVAAVEDAHLVAEAGRITTLLGPSGCGKTTTLRMIAGFIRPDAGDVYIGDHRVNDLPPHRRPTRTVFQNYALFPHMRVAENVAFGLEQERVPRAERERRVEDALAAVGLAGFGARQPGQLSGGQQQRVALARALVTRPSVLLLDEPLSNLDAKLRVSTREEIRRLQRQVGITTIYVTHDQEEALSLSDRVVVMHQGRILQEGTPTEIYERPATRFVAEFLGLSNFPRGRVLAADGSSARVDFGGYQAVVEAAAAAAVGSLVIALVRPENLLLAPADLGDGGWRGVVQGVSYLGSVARYRVAVPGQPELVVDQHAPDGGALLAPGAAVTVALRGGKAYLPADFAADAADAEGGVAAPVGGTGA
jgi:ABC-type Fe3+/spermidine/putrescine transport system ATPase subunit